MNWLRNNLAKLGFVLFMFFLGVAVSLPEEATAQCGGLFARIAARRAEARGYANAGCSGGSVGYSYGYAQQQAPAVRVVYVTQPAEARPALTRPLYSDEADCPYCRQPRSRYPGASSEPPKREIPTREEDSRWARRESSEAFQVALIRESPRANPGW